MKNVVVVGAGFAACTAVRTLRKRGYADKITLIAPRAELFYYPSLIWVPAGKRDYDDLAIPIDDFLQSHRADFVPGKVTALDSNDKTVSVGTESLSYDAIIIASGGRYLRRLPGIEHACIACAGWDDTKRFSDRLASMQKGTIAFGFAGNPNEPSAMRGGPVFEFLFGVDTLLRKQGRRDNFELVFFSPAPRPGKRMGEKAVARLLNEMKKRGIRTSLGSKMKRFDADSVSTEAETFAADLILFIPGMTGPEWAQDTDLSLSDGGFFKANRFCQVDGQEAVFVAGDAGSFPGPEWKPKQAHMADLQAEAAAKNVIEVLQGQPARHTFKTELICIVDTLTSGSLVYRGEKRSLMIKMRPMHWAKRFFERLYLRAYQ